VQLCIKPGAYKVSSALQISSDDDVEGAVQQIDAKFSNSEEWSTKERGSIFLRALLIRID